MRILLRLAMIIGVVACSGLAKSQVVVQGQASASPPMPEPSTPPVAEVLPANTPPQPARAFPTPNQPWAPPKWGPPQASLANPVLAETAPKPGQGLPTPELIQRRLFYSRPAGGRVQVDLFPGAGDPSDIQTNPLLNSNPMQVDAGLGEAVDLALPFLIASRDTPLTSADAAKVPVFRLGLQTRPGIHYDTGFLNSKEFYPGLIALNGTSDAHNRGQLFFDDIPTTAEEIPSLVSRLQFDAQAQDILATGPSQAYVDALVVNDNQLVARTAVVRALDPGEINGYTFGKVETTFGDIGSVPMIIANGGAPVGAVAVVTDLSALSDVGVAQLRYSHYFLDDNAEFSMSIEDQMLLDAVDVSTLAGDTVLHRWPVFVQRIRLRGATNFDSYQIASLIRPITFDDSHFNDHTATGWGISALARCSDACSTNAIYCGLAGGQGVGGYIYGGTKAAVITNDTTVRLLGSVGGYAAYQHVWYALDAGHNLSSSIAYGFVRGEAATLADNRFLQQAWCNLLFNATSDTAFGLEYQFGEREIGSGNHGVDHRIMFVLQYTPPAATTKGTARESAIAIARENSATQPETMNAGAVAPGSLSQRRF